MGIKSNQRGKDDVDSGFDDDGLTIQLWFGNPETVAGHRGISLEIDEQQMAFTKRMEYR